MDEEVKKRLENLEGRVVILEGKKQEEAPAEEAASAEPAPAEEPETTTTG